MNETTKIGIMLGILLLVPSLVLIGISYATTWFGMMGNWTEYVYWFWVSCYVSRVVYALAIPVLVGVAIYFEEWKYLFSIPPCIILAVWGIPILYESVLLLVTTPLTGLEFQQTILKIIIIKWFVHGALSDLKRYKKDES